MSSDTTWGSHDTRVLETQLLCPISVPLMGPRPRFPQPRTVLEPGCPRGPSLCGAFHKCWGSLVSTPLPPSPVHSALARRPNAINPSMELREGHPICASSQPGPDSLSTAQSRSAEDLVAPAAAGWRWLPGTPTPSSLRLPSPLPSRCQCHFCGASVPDTALCLGRGYWHLLRDAPSWSLLPSCLCTTCLLEEGFS